jgi:hypothetical protein
VGRLPKTEPGSSAPLRCGRACGPGGRSPCQVRGHAAALKNRAEFAEPCGWGELISRGGAALDGARHPRHPPRCARRGRVMRSPRGSASIRPATVPPRPNVAAMRVAVADWQRAAVVREGWSNS